MTDASDANTSSGNASRVSFSPAQRRQKLAGKVAVPRSHKIGEAIIFALSWVSILAVILILLFVGREGFPLLWDLVLQEDLGGLRQLIVSHQWPGYESAQYVWQPVGFPGKFNIIPLLLASLKITLLALAIGVPFALLAAIFVSQYAPPRTRTWIKSAIELLASVPSVVLGFFALLLFASVLQSLFGFHYRLNSVVAGFGLALALIPVVFTVSEDALYAVPKELKEAAFALGARRHHVISRVVLPAALPGITAAIILGFGRAIGETMIVLMASGNAATMSLNLASSGRTITATIASELGEVSEGDGHWRVLFLLGTLLFLVTLSLNRIGIWFSREFAQRMEGKRA